MTSTTTPATTSPADRRRAGTVSASEHLFIGMAPLRRAAVWRNARWIPDADAAVDAAVWEAIHSGVTDRLALYNVARYAAVTHRRAELRHQRRRRPMHIEHPDPVAERAVDVVDADLKVRQLLANVPTSPDVLRWIDRKVSQPVIGDPLPSRVKQAGRRWATRARSELEACDEVA